MVKVLLFGPAREAVDAGEFEVSVEDGFSVSDLREALGRQCPALEALLKVSRFSVDQEMIQDESACKPAKQDEIAFIPPISGG
mmetsp:Transcript_94685/g.149797  ORF Transcript_94685/g.149797 Transcript_94685/m.149797 type:complete len:83 (-) Transcript_94685:74-322(-)